MEKKLLGALIGIYMAMGALSVGIGLVLIKKFTNALKDASLLGRLGAESAASSEENTSSSRRDALGNIIKSRIPFGK